jgi:hypothetical protein
MTKNKCDLYVDGECMIKSMQGLCDMGFTICCRECVKRTSCSLFHCSSCKFRTCETGHK